VGRDDDGVVGQMEAMAQANRADLARSREHLKEVSRGRLLRIVETKLRTTMIGALAAVEEAIGRELWGHGKPERDCTPEQLRWRAVWQEKVRPAVLNNGNNQIRAVQSEVTLYDIVWKGYHTVLPVKGTLAGGTI
jgi:hypothetical protein